ncbi:MAG: hypothetical protein R3310_12010 [Candidatus Competibacteraceae bacterium]|nr:hypothetical protein [Candidatus Competibacteraceae bacterium]
MTIRYIATTLAALAFGATLPAQAQGFNDRTEIGFGSTSQASRVVVQAQLEGFNDRSGVAVSTPWPARQDLGPQMVDTELEGFNDKNSA